MSFNNIPQHTKLLIIFIFMLPLSLFAQKNRVLKTNIILQGKDCASDTTAKQLVFEMMAGNTYRTVTTGAIHQCPFTKAVPAGLVGKFRVTVFAEGFNSQTVELEIIKTSKDTIVLPDIILPKKIQTLQAVVVNSGQKKFIEITAEKTTVQVKDNDVLVNGSVYDAIGNLPGIIRDLSGMVMHNGKPMTVWIDGQPSYLSGQDLVNFLNALPANAIEKIEIIGNPGAAYDANSAGGILNIITGHRKLKGISGTASVNYLRNRYDKILPSLQLNGMKGKLNWQFLTTYSYSPNSSNASSRNIYKSFSVPPTLLRQDDNETKPRNYFLLAGINYSINPTIDIGFRYSYTKANRSSTSNGSNGFMNATSLFLTSNGNAISGNDRNEWIAFYKQKFDSAGHTTLELKGTLTNNNVDGFSSSAQVLNPGLPAAFTTYSVVKNYLRQDVKTIKADMGMPVKQWRATLNFGGKYSTVSHANTGYYNLNNISATIISTPAYITNTPFAYKENNAAAYITLNKNLGTKLNVSTGLRLEHFTVNSKIEGRPSFIDTNYTNLFPEVRLLYKVNAFTKFIASYSKKIQQPTYSELDPNIVSYHDSLVSQNGNPALLPTFAHTIETELTIFDYANIGFSYSYNKYPHYLVFEAVPNSLLTTNTNKSFASLKTFSINSGIPLPFKLFTEGLAFFNNAGNINIDELNFLYLSGSLIYSKVNGAAAYVGSQQPFLFLSAYAQIILPKKIHLTINYVNGKGTYNIYELNSYQKNLSFYLSKTFLKKTIKLTLGANDVFNTAKTSATLGSPYLQTRYVQKTDSRVFNIGLTFNFGKFALLHKSAEIKNDETEKQRMEKQQGIRVN